MENSEFSIYNVMKLFVNAIGQDAFKDFYGTNWSARKKEIQKLEEIEIQKKEFERFTNILNDWANWAEENGYINSWDKYSICFLYFPFVKAAAYPKKATIELKEYIKFSTMYSICYVFRQVAIDMKKHNIENAGLDPLRGALFSYNFWFNPESGDYKNEFSPINGVFKLFFYLTEHKKKIFDFWNERKEEFQNKDTDSDLRIQIRRWTKGKQCPTWKMVKMFLNEDLKPDDSLFINLFDYEEENSCYLLFRRKLFSAYFITRFFNSLIKQKLMDNNTKIMIRRGVILFYRYFFEEKSFDTFTDEERKNPMLHMMVHFLINLDMGVEIDFDTDADFYFFNIRSPYINLQKPKGGR